MLKPQHIFLQGFNPLLQCSAPKCEPGCIIDYEATPCPSCKCSEDGRKYFQLKAIHFCLKIV